MLEQVLAEPAPDELRAVQDTLVETRIAASAVVAEIDKALRLVAISLNGLADALEEGDHDE
jgi:hypothetical protein